MIDVLVFATAMCLIVGAIFSLVGAIVGEFFVGDDVKGLGVLIQNKSGGFATDELYATVLVSTLLGVAMFVSVTVTGEWVLRRFFGMSLSGMDRA